MTILNLHSQVKMMMKTFINTSPHGMCSAKAFDQISDLA